MLLKILKLIHEVKNQFERKIKRTRSHDRGREYESNEFNPYSPI